MQEGPDKKGAPTSEPSADVGAGIAPAPAANVSAPIDPAIAQLAQSLAQMLASAPGNKTNGLPPFAYLQSLWTRDKLHHFSYVWKRASL